MRRLALPDHLVSGTGAFACGSPDGRVLRDGQALEVFLGGRWVSGSLAHHAHQSPQFVASSDQSICGLACASACWQTSPKGDQQAPLAAQERMFDETVASFHL